MVWFFDEALMLPVGKWVILFTDIEDSCFDVSVTAHANWYYFRSRVISQLFTPLVLGASLFGQSDSSPAQLTATNLHLDCCVVRPESDKEAVLSTLSQRLSGLKTMVWLCSPVPTCSILQSRLPPRVRKVSYGCWEFLVLRRWAVAVTLGLSGMWREGQRQGVEGCLGQWRRPAGRNEE